MGSSLTSASVAAERSSARAHRGRCDPRDVASLIPDASRPIPGCTADAAAADSGDRSGAKRDGDSIAGAERTSDASASDATATSPLAPSRNASSATVAMEEKIGAASLAPTRRSARHSVSAATRASSSSQRVVSGPATPLDAAAATAAAATPPTVARTRDRCSAHSPPTPAGSGSGSGSGASPTRDSAQTKTPRNAARVSGDETYASSARRRHAPSDARAAGFRALSPTIKESASAHPRVMSRTRSTPPPAWTCAGVTATAASSARSSAGSSARSMTSLAVDPNPGGEVIAFISAAPSTLVMMRVAFKHASIATVVSVSAKTTSSVASNVATIPAVVGAAPTPRATSIAVAAALDAATIAAAASPAVAACVGEAIGQSNVLPVKR
eukprot:29982-Pelagococcus_subviridis.AAC.4